MDGPEGPRLVLIKEGFERLYPPPVRLSIRSARELTQQEREIWGRDIAVRFAGPAAQRCYEGKAAATAFDELWDYGARDCDLAKRMAMALATDGCGDPALYMKRFGDLKVEGVADAERIIRCNWGAVNAIARLLEVEDWISRERIEQIARTYVLAIEQSG